MLLRPINKIRNLSHCCIKYELNYNFILTKTSLLAGLAVKQNELLFSFQISVAGKSFHRRHF